MHEYLHGVSTFFLPPQEEADDFGRTASLTALQRRKDWQSGRKNIQFGILRVKESTLTIFTGVEDTGL